MSLIRCNHRWGPEVRTVAASKGMILGAQLRRVCVHCDQPHIEINPWLKMTLPYLTEARLN